MNIVVAVKIVPDDQDIQVAADRTLDYSKARPTVSTYDLNAIEAAAKLAADTGSKLTAVAVGDASINDSKTVKNILARGVDELVIVPDDTLADMDAHATAAALAAAIGKVEGADVAIFGDGSADLYAQQTDVQTAEVLGWPVVTAVSEIAVEGETIVATRTLETQREVVEVALPVALSVVPDIALPRICGMKDILQAGKKPQTKLAAADLGATAAAGVEVVSTLAPEPTPRKKEIFDFAADGDLDKFVAALKDAIR